MTIKEFVLWLPHANAWVRRKTGFGLTVYPHTASGTVQGIIRSVKHHERYDPLNAVIALLNEGAYYDLSNREGTRKALRMRDRDFMKLVDAIDQTEFYDWYLRHRILKALRLPIEVDA